MVLPLFWLTHLKGHDYKAERLAELAERLRLGSLDFVFLPKSRLLDNLLETESTGELPQCTYYTLHSVKYSVAL